jgi:cyclase
MPLCYGGGIKTAEQAEKIFSLGVEKIAISSAVIDNPALVKELAEKVGTQSVVVVLDVKKKIFGGYEVVTHNATKKTGIDPVKLTEELEALGIGEIVINSVDNDGVMKGYDFGIIDKVKAVATVPMTVLGGAGSMDDIGAVIKKHGIIGVAAWSLFVFKGKYKAVLINYPKHDEKEKLVRENFKGIAI